MAIVIVMAYCGHCNSCGRRSHCDYCGAIIRHGPSVRPGHSGCLGPVAVVVPMAVVAPVALMKLVVIVTLRQCGPSDDYDSVVFMAVVALVAVVTARDNCNACGRRKMSLCGWPRVNGLVQTALRVGLLDRIVRFYRAHCLAQIA